MRLLAGVALAGSVVAPIRGAFAKDGHDGGHDGDGHGHDGHDDNGHDDNNDGGDDDNKGKNLTDQDEALSDVQSGRIIPLKTALKIVDDRVQGKVIDVRLTKTLGRSQYRIKVRRNNGAITTIRLDARTGGFVGMLGF